MTSKKYGWQKRWMVDREAGTATHETGLQVVAEGGRVRSLYPEIVSEALKQKHGHNAPEMVRRLLKEARILLVQP